MKIPCKNGETYEMSPQLVESYRTLYANADRAFAQMTIWLENHKSGRPKTASSARTFVTNWFAKVPLARPQSASERNAAVVRQLTGRSGHVIDITPRVAGWLD